ncbi:hypothetical protein AHMF7616_03643 [Adhaeribacter pallidiroseus]|uniref:Uncharacterized protein n=1 Tax=Adhaeribacter pallidiroseus TaxID=2072847 RepID=A0A369QL00_9BACT|nr:hypothetical protein AHMF7616_03643 [Adhaeribacter pallidiroseus]
MIDPGLIKIKESHKSLLFDLGWFTPKLKRGYTNFIKILTACNQPGNSQLAILISRKPEQVSLEK